MAAKRGILGVDDILRRQVQRADEGLFSAPAGSAAGRREKRRSRGWACRGQAGDGLVDDGLKNGGSQIGSVAPSLMSGWMSDLANTPQRAAMG